MKKTKIIFFIDDPPAYESFRDDEIPEIHWITPDGNWIGIWGIDWAVQIGNSILSATNDFYFEVWQPELRADRVYEHIFPNGLKHRMFPAERIKHFKTYKYVNEWYSNKMLEELEDYYANHEDLIISFRLEDSKFNMNLLKQVKNQYPVIGNSLGAPELLFFLYGNEKLHKRIVKKIRYKTYIKALKNFKYILLGDFFQDWKYQKVHKLLPQSMILTYCIGLEESYLINQPMDKKSLRKRFGLPSEAKIFLSSSRLNPLKQVNRIIECFAQIREMNFFLIISGSGTSEYINYLENLIRQLNLTEKVRIMGFVSESELIELYKLSDCFIDASKLDGGPNSARKAVALGIPVLTTATGSVGAYLVSHSFGGTLEKNNYRQWTKQFSDFIEYNHVKIIDPSEAHKIYNWDYCANKLLKRLWTVQQDFAKNKKTTGLMKQELYQFNENIL